MKRIQEKTFLPTGLSEFDQFLGGGWFCGGITEVLGRSGGGKTTLAARSMAERTRQKEAVAFIGDGETLFPPALSGIGVDLSQLLWLRPREEERKRWALEQVVRSGLFPLVVASRVLLSERIARRVQLALEGNGAVALILNAQKSSLQNWAIALQCEVKRSEKGLLKINILKSRRSIQGRECEVHVYEQENYRRLSSESAVLRKAS